MEKVFSRFVSAVIVVLVTGCGIDLKAPKEMNANVNLDASAIVEKTRDLFNSKVPPQVYRFLNDPKLLSQIEAFSKRYQVRCLKPIKEMVEVEKQIGVFVLTMNQECFSFDHLTGKVKGLSYSLSGSVAADKWKYEILLEDSPQISEFEISPAEYQELLEHNRFLDEQGSH